MIPSVAAAPDAATARGGARFSPPSTIAAFSAEPEPSLPARLRDSFRRPAAFQTTAAPNKRLAREDGQPNLMEPHAWSRT